MPSFDDVTQVNCSGTITYEVDGETFVGYVLLPCGADFDTTSLEGKQIPYKYQIYRERASLAPCCYWREDTDPDLLDPTIPSSNVSTSVDPGAYSFVNVTASGNVLPKIEIINSDGEKEEIDDPDLEVIGGWQHEIQPSFLIPARKFLPILINGATSIPTKCKKVGAEIWNQGQDQTPPCNGAKTECPFYTGPRFKYINDEQMAPGQPIIGQMVQELRSLILDWKSLTDGQSKWESSFDIPYIWGRDFDDQPTAIAQEDYEPAELEEIPVYTILTKIFWDVLLEDATLTKLPSEFSGTDLNTEGGDNLTPPDFPTIINDLGSALIPPIKLTFPNAKEDEQYEYIAFDKEGMKIYLAGTTTNVNNVYAVNRTLVPECPDIENMLLNEEEQAEILEDFITSQVVKSFSLSIPGFTFTKADASRFWEVRGGIDLAPKKLNIIYILVRNSSKWSYRKLLVNFKFTHSELIQNGHSGIVPQPQTRTLLERWANLNTKDSVDFNLVPLSDQSTEIVRAYHFHIFDRSNSRFLRTINPPPNLRFWKIIKQQRFIVGTGNVGGSLIWSKFDNCNRYLVEITTPVLSAAVPMGIDRSWEPVSIKFTIEQEPGTSGHGEQQTTEVEMKVVEEFGRSYDGNLLPVRYMIIEPKEDIAFKTPFTSSLLSVQLETYTAVNVLEEGDDSFFELYEKFPDPNYPQSAGGVRLASPTDEDSLPSTDLHNITVLPNKLSVGAIQKYDMSYIVEVGLKNNKGELVISGRKWVYGVADMYDVWARDVDIKYAWGDTQQFNRIFPDYHRARNDKPADTLGQYWATLDLIEKDYIVNKPACGDHENSFGKSGPMFAPYNDCETPVTVINNLGIRVNYRPRVEGGSGLIMPERADEKYRAPDEYYPVIYKHNVLAYIFFKCYFEFSFGHYKRTGNANWVGFARIRGPISEDFFPLKYLFFKANNWTLPTFGNIGREKIRINRTMHYREYIFLSGSQPKVANGWMPGIPFIGSSSIFDKTLPRTLYDQIVETQQSRASMDYSDPDNIDLIMSKSTPGIEPVNGIGNTTETFFFERKKFDDVYRVKKIRTKEGRGSRFPDDGFYFNFRSNNVVWAFPEEQVPLVRNKKNYSSNYIDSTSFIGGITVENTTTLSGSIRDRFNRPVSISLPESRYSLKIKNEVYDEATNSQLTAYASIYINESYPLYFDRFTGEIKNSPSPSFSGIPPMYTVSDKAELTTLTTSGLYFTVDPVFEFINNTEEQSAPIDSTDLSKLSEFINYGNLYTDISKMLIYADVPFEGPLSDDDIPWIGFFPSIKVNSIFPQYLPKSELQVNSDDLKVKVNFSRYPGIDWRTREPISNLDLNDYGQIGFISPVQSIPDQFDWKPYDTQDIVLETPVVSGVDVRKGQVEGFTVDVKLPRSIELSYLAIGYTVYGLFDFDLSDVEDGDEIPFEVDPKFEIKVYNSLTNDYITLIEKQNINFKNNSLPELTRYFVFSIREEQEQTDSDNNAVRSISKIAPIVTNQIQISVGPRKPRTGFKLNNLTLKHLILNEAAEESIAVLEPQFLITTGLYQEGNPLYKPAQDTNRLTGIVATKDNSDLMEHQGIAETYKTLDFEENQTKTRGKLRREWANKFLTYDTIRYFDENLGTEDEVVFFDSTVDKAEERQTTMIKNLLDAFDTHEELKKLEYELYLSPQDRNYLIKEELNYSSLADYGKIAFTGTPFDLNDIFVVAKSDNIKSGNLSLPWSDKGFRACVTDDTDTAKCGPVVAEEHTVCNARLFDQFGYEGSSLGSFSLFEVVSTFEDASGISTVGALQTGNNQEYQLKAFENAQATSTQRKIDAYREDLANKKLIYKP